MMKSASIRAGLLILVPCLSIAVFTSCSGEKPSTIRGTVLLDGAPVSTGVVQFHGAGEHLVTAVIRSDGTFTATDLRAGEVKVAVVEDIMTMSKGKSAKKGSIKIPAKYKAVSTSGLNYNITPTTTQIRISLASK